MSLVPPRLCGSVWYRRWLNRDSSLLAQQNWLRLSQRRLHWECVLHSHRQDWPFGAIPMLDKWLVGVLSFAVCAHGPDIICSNSCYPAQAIVSRAGVCTRNELPGPTGLQCPCSQKHGNEQSGENYPDE